MEQTECSETLAFQLQTPVNHSLAYEDGTDCSEALAFKLQTPVNHPGEIIQHSEHGESLKSRTTVRVLLPDFRSVIIFAF
jgi:hypothetical protein